MINLDAILKFCIIPPGKTANEVNGMVENLPKQKKIIACPYRGCWMTSVCPSVCLHDFDE
jgi:hypothetical protein